MRRRVEAPARPAGQGRVALAAAYGLRRTLALTGLPGWTALASISRPSRSTTACAPLSGIYPSTALGSACSQRAWRGRCAAIFSSGPAGGRFSLADEPLPAAATVGAGASELFIASASGKVGTVKVRHGDAVGPVAHCSLTRQSAALPWRRKDRVGSAETALAGGWSAARCGSHCPGRTRAVRAGGKRALL